MPKLRAGDRVRVIESLAPSYFNVGEILTVADWWWCVDGPRFHTAEKPLLPLLHTRAEVVGEDATH